MPGLLLGQSRLAFVRSALTWAKLKCEEEVFVNISVVFLISSGSVIGILKEQESLDGCLYALVSDLKYFIQVTSLQSSKEKDGLGREKALLSEAPLPFPEPFPELFPKLTHCWPAPPACAHGSGN